MLDTVKAGHGTTGPAAYSAAAFNPCRRGLQFQPQDHWKYGNSPVRIRCEDVCRSFLSVDGVGLLRRMHGQSERAEGESVGNRCDRYCSGVVERSKHAHCYLNFSFGSRLEQVALGDVDYQSRRDGEDVLPSAWLLPPVATELMWKVRLRVSVELLANDSARVFDAPCSTVPKFIILYSISRPWP